jgi:hypothetical protein
MLKICLFCLFIAPIYSHAEHKSALVDNPSFLADTLISASVLSSPSICLAERTNRALSRKSAQWFICVYRQDRRFETYEEALEHIGRFIDFYNGKRPHYSVSPFQRFNG